MLIPTCIPVNQSIKGLIIVSNSSLDEGHQEAAGQHISPGPTVDAAQAQRHYIATYSPRCPAAHSTLAFEPGLSATDFQRFSTLAVASRV